MIVIERCLCLNILLFFVKFTAEEAVFQADWESLPLTGHHPSAREGAATWQDSLGTLWMFGGFGPVDNKSDPEPLNDLWNFFPQNHTWKMISNLSTHNIPDGRLNAVVCGYVDTYFMVYGGHNLNGDVLGDTWIYEITKNRWIPVICNASADNCNTQIEHPKNRTESASWCLKDRMLIYSGVDKNLTLLDDFWEFSLLRLSWKKININSTLLKPKPRNGAVTWNTKHIDKWNRTSIDLYMFGGNVLNMVHLAGRPRNAGYVAQLWKFSLSNKTWVLVNGIANYQLLVSQCVGHYGKMKVPSPTNRPGCRKLAASWVDNSGNLWLYGGIGTATKIPYIYTYGRPLSDLWHFNVKTLMWSWIGGSNTEESLRTGTQPGGRYNGAYWTYNHTMYLYGGYGFNGFRQTHLSDLWSIRVMSQTFDSDSKIDRHPVFIFFISLTVLFVGFGLFGLILFVKKIIGGPRHPPVKGAAIKYCRLQSNVKFDF